MSETTDAENPTPWHLDYGYYGYDVFCTADGKAISRIVSLATGRPLVRKGARWRAVCDFLTSKYSESSGQSHADLVHADAELAKELAKHAELMLSLPPGRHRRMGLVALDGGKDPAA